jgi:Flp pilus assembly pilin Flp
MFAKIKNLMVALHRDERGAMSVEKILILGVIALPILIILYLFKNKIVEYFNGQASQLPTN